MFISQCSEKFNERLSFFSAFLEEALDVKIKDSSWYIQLKCSWNIWSEMVVFTDEIFGFL